MKLARYKLEINKKGFTLVELLATIIIISIVALIARPILVGILDDIKREAFKREVESGINSFIFTVDNARLKGEKIDYLDAQSERLNLEHNKFIGGGFYNVEKDKYIAVSATDGVYCANGEITDLLITKGNCNSVINDFTVDVEDGWTNRPKEVTINHDKLTGLYYYLSNTNQKPECADDSWKEVETFDKEVGTYYAYVRDMACNISVGKTAIVNQIDLIRPKLSFKKENKVNKFDVKITATDEGGSGLASDNVYQYCLSPKENDTSECTWVSYNNGENFYLESKESLLRYLYVKRVKDVAGNYSSDEENMLLETIDFGELDTVKPTLTVSPSSETYEESGNVTITVSDNTGGSGLASTNVYKYCLSTSSTTRENCEWTTYTSGTSFDITGTNQTKYLWVWPVKDKAGNINDDHINVNTPYVAGIYKFITTYTITYNLNEGTATNNTSYNIETETFTLNNPTRSDYIFTGWTGSNGSTPSTSVSIPKGSTGNKTYTANWASGTQTFVYTGTVQTFTAPITGYYQVDLYGAAGGVGGLGLCSGGNPGSGGKGGYVSARVRLTGGTTYTVYVGGAGGYGGSADPAGRAGYEDGTAGGHARYVSGSGGGGGGSTRLLHETTVYARANGGGGGGGGADGGYHETGSGEFNCGGCKYRNAGSGGGGGGTGGGGTSGGGGASNSCGATGSSGANGTYYVNTTYATLITGTNGSRSGNGQAVITYLNS